MSSVDRGRDGDGRVPTAGDAVLVTALRRGDEAAFAALVRRHHPTMVRVAMTHVRTRAVAEEVAQDAWVGVLRGIDRFEGRSSLRTWIFRILVNVARTRAVREARTVPFPTSPDAGPGEPSPDPSPEECLLAGETLAAVRRAVDDLPAGQRAVIALRDLRGWDAGEVCAFLGISEGNQRVRLHRARSTVRRDLQAYLAVP